MEEVPDSRPRDACGGARPAEREVDPVAPHDPRGERIELDEPRDERALRLALVAVELPDERPSLDGRAPEARGVVRDVVHDAVAADGLDARLEAVEWRAACQWKYWPPSMTIVWPVTNDGGRAGEIDDRADDVLGLLVALDRPRRDRDVAELLDHLGVLLHPVGHREAGATQLTRTPSLPSSFASARVNATMAPLLVT